MTKKVAEKKEVAKKKATVEGHGPARGPFTREIKGPLLFQRTGQGMAIFKLVDPNILSNPLVQLPADVLPLDYGPDKYTVTGEFLFRITVREK